MYAGRSKKVAASGVDQPGTSSGDNTSNRIPASTPPYTQYEIKRCSIVRFCRLTLAITWPQAVIGEERNLAMAAQVNGDVREWQEYQAREAVTLAP